MREWCSGVLWGAALQRKLTCSLRRPPVPHPPTPMPELPLAQPVSAVSASWHDVLFVRCFARLAAMPTVALGQMRRNLAEAMECDFATALIREAEGQRVAGDSEDAREGAMAFLQKRKPEFKGR